MVKLRMALYKKYEKSQIKWAFDKMLIVTYFKLSLKYIHAFNIYTMLNVCSWRHDFKYVECLSWFLNKINYMFTSQ